MSVTLITGEVVNEELFTYEEILVLKWAMQAVEYLARQEMLEPDHTETADSILENAPVIIRKLDRMIDGEEDDEGAQMMADNIQHARRTT